MSMDAVAAFADESFRSRHLERVPLKAGDVLFRQGDPADAMFFIESGELAVVLEVAGAERSALRRLGAGQCLGEMAMYRDDRRTATVEAVNDAVLWRLSVARLHDMESADPALALALHKQVAARLAERVSFSNQEVKEPLARLAHALRNLATSDFSNEAWNRPAVAEAARRSDEVGEVAQAMEFLVGRLDAYLHQLRVTTAAKEAIESELRIAGEIQSSLLPPELSPAEAKRMDFAAMIKPAREAGGDLYDGFFLPDGRFFVMVGDVSGKGVPAAVFMALTAMCVRALVRQVSDPGQLLAQVNRLLCERNETLQFVTAFAAVLNPATGELHWANAGHPSAAVLSRDGLIWLEGPRSAPLAVFEDTAYVTQSCTLAAEAMLLIYSDGVSEAMTPQSELLGNEGIEQCLAGKLPADASRVVSRLVRAVHDHEAGAAQTDDITVVAVRCLA